MEQEGVIKFDLRHRDQPLGKVDMAELRSWRLLLHRLGLVGQAPDRYGGLGFGNISMRMQAGFLVSGSQTGGQDDPGPEGYALVTGWSIAENMIESMGEVPPSSESLTHAGVYELLPDIRYVFHVHSPDIWQARLNGESDLPVTGADVAYGTPAMAQEVARVCAGRSVPNGFVMAGHEDGVVTYGANAEDAGLLLVRLLAAAMSKIEIFL